MRKTTKTVCESKLASYWGVSEFSRTLHIGFTILFKWNASKFSLDYVPFDLSGAHNVNFDMRL